MIHTRMAAAAAAAAATPGTGRAAASGAAAAEAIGIGAARGINAGRKQAEETALAGRGVSTRIADEIRHDFSETLKKSGFVFNINIGAHSLCIWYFYFLYIGVAAATELRRPAPSRSFCTSRLDATRWMRSQHHFLYFVDLNFNGRGPQS